MPKPFLSHQAMFDPSFPHGRWYYFKSCDVAELSDEIIDVTVEHTSRISSPLTSFPIWQMGGAVSRVADDETAFSGRSSRIHLQHRRLYRVQGRVRAGAGVGPRLLVSAHAVARRRVRQLPGR